MFRCSTMFACRLVEMHCGCVHTHCHISIEHVPATKRVQCNFRYILSETPWTVIPNELIYFIHIPNTFFCSAKANKGKEPATLARISIARNIEPQSIANRDLWGTLTGDLSLWEPRKSKRFTLSSFCWIVWGIFFGAKRLILVAHLRHLQALGCSLALAPSSLTHTLDILHFLLKVEAVLHEKQELQEQAESRLERGLLSFVLIEAARILRLDRSYLLEEGLQSLATRM